MIDDSRFDAADQQKSTTQQHSHIPLTENAIKNARTTKTSPNLMQTMMFQLNSSTKLSLYSSGIIRSGSKTCGRHWNF